MPYERLLELADKLENVPPDKFDYSAWVLVDPESTRTLKRKKECDQADLLPHLISDASCGTKGCALGWCTVFWPNDWEFNGKSPVLKHVSEGRANFEPFSAAEKFFGISYDDAQMLFMPDEDAGDEEDFTPRDVAFKIRDFVAFQ